MTLENSFNSQDLIRSKNSFNPQDLIRSKNSFIVPDIPQKLMMQVSELANRTGRNIVIEFKQGSEIYRPVTWKEHKQTNITNKKEFKNKGPTHISKQVANYNIQKHTEKRVRVIKTEEEPSFFNIPKINKVFQQSWEDLLIVLGYVLEVLLCLV